MRRTATLRQKMAAAALMVCRYGKEHRLFTAC